MLEKTVERQDIFCGRIINVHRDIVELEDGERSFREIVDHHGGVGVLALDEKGRVPLVRQYRYAYKRDLIEIPAGKLEAGEDPAFCAVRELGEETGLTAGRLISLGFIYPTPGYCSEIIHLYLALDLHAGRAHPDEGEFVTAFSLPFEELCRRVLCGEINDSKTVAAALRAREYLKGSPWAARD